MNKVSKFFLLSLCALFVMSPLLAEPTGRLRRMMDSTPITEVIMDRLQDRLTVAMQVDLSRVNVGGNKAYYIIPIIKKGEQEVELAPIGLLSRGRFISNSRRGQTDAKPMQFTERERPGVVRYHDSAPYQNWMDGSELVLCYREYGCCDHLLAEARESISTFTRPTPPAPVEFRPKFLFVRPEAEARKDRALSGEAYVTFPVNRTEVFPNYHDNPRELGKIRATIDSVRLDSDITITGIWLKGYASPEGSYAANERLAKGRSLAIRDYVQKLYPFPSSVYSVDYEPENWEGLRNFVLSNPGLGNNLAILDIIDAGGDPDARESKLKSRYAKEYKYLLEHCYPYLRRTDYRVEYTIRSYADAREILQILKTRPQNLSLNEFYLAAAQFGEGTPEFDDVFATAVRMYPGDPVANLNAAMAELDGGKLSTAERFLQRAGDSPEATYARGLWQALSGNLDAAEPILKKAESLGVTQATDALEQMEAVRAYQKELAAFTAKYGEAAL